MNAQLRIKKELWQELEMLLFSRYPHKEWATFFTFGFRKSYDSSGAPIFVITVADLIKPENDDLNPKVGFVEFHSNYSLRTALTVEKTPLCVGVVHSHPQNCKPVPSYIDDDMDNYYSEYFKDFTKEDCYSSLVFSRDKNNSFSFSGRGWVDGEAFKVNKIIVIGEDNIEIKEDESSQPSGEFTTRIENVYGNDARVRLYNSCVTIVGCGGTGSAVAHILARAGIKKFILIDFDKFEDSNLEKMHGSNIDHTNPSNRPYKVEIVRDNILSINPDAEIISIVGNILDPLSKDYTTASDLIISCTDSSHSRVAVSELAYRYLVPVIDVGVQLEGNDTGKVKAEIIQIVKYIAGLPCIYCRELIDQWRLDVELMSEEEKIKRKKDAENAKKNGVQPSSYWKDLPVLHTVGHLTSLAGSFAASYAIGWITGKIKIPSNYFQINIIEEDFGYVSVNQDRRFRCACNNIEGFADQGSNRTVISASSHWPKAFII